MKLSIDKNMIDARELAVALSTFISDTPEFVVKSIRENYEYVDGKKTDKFLSTTLTCIDTISYVVLDIKVEKHLNLTAQQLEQSDTPIYVEIPLEETIVRPYAIEYGKAKVSIIAPSVKIIKN